MKNSSTVESLIVLIKTCQYFNYTPSQWYSCLMSCSSRFAFGLFIHNVVINFFLPLFKGKLRGKAQKYGGEWTLRKQHNYSKLPLFYYFLFFLESYGNYGFGYCEAGMSTSGVLYDNKPLFVVGAPGSLNFMGMLSYYVLCGISKP